MEKEIIQNLEYETIENKEKGCVEHYSKGKLSFEYYENGTLCLNCNQEEVKELYVCDNGCCNGCEGCYGGCEDDFGGITFDEHSSVEESKEFIAEIITWFDKRNGNSYFSARVYDLKMKLLFVCPFQYGYGSHPRDTVLGNIDALVLSVHMHKHDLAKLVYFNERKGTKKECVQNGKEL